EEHRVVESAIWWRLASFPAVARRALRYALGVGAVLIAINHGDAIVRKDISTRRLVQMLLTVTVPYAVSTASSIGAMRDCSRRGAQDGRTVGASEE
ncbi:MAG: nitrate/nitrite transporter NrtS, partial [Vicinamibacterales bacterium]